jgi:hypothetical protein
MPEEDVSAHSLVRSASFCMWATRVAQTSWRTSAHTLCTHGPEHRRVACARLADDAQGDPGGIRPVHIRHKHVTSAR